MNLAILAHVDAGKTTLTEHLLLESGVIRTAGSVDLGTAKTDFLEIEQKRGISIRSASTQIPLKEGSCNLIDTPGHIDFIGEVERSFCAIDEAILLISSSEGIQAQTEALLKILLEKKIPTIIFINKIDRTGSHAELILNELQKKIGKRRLLPLFRIQNEGEKDVSIFPKDKSELLEEQLEVCADFLDDAANEYLESKIDETHIQAWFETLVMKGQIFPVFYGSAKNHIGVSELYEALPHIFKNSQSDPNGPLSGIVFQISHDPDMGRIAHVRLFGGTLKSRDTLTYNRTDSDGAPIQDKISQIRISNGQKWIDKGEAQAGDLVALCGLSSARVYDTFGTIPENRMVTLANPYLSCHVEPQKPEDLPKLIEALRQLDVEDPLLSFQYIPITKELLLHLTGPIQIEVLEALLQTRFHLQAHFTPPSIIYKETLSKPARGFAAYTMPKPCWAIVEFQMKPGKQGSGVVYNPGSVPSDQLYYRYQEHIKRSFYESLVQGLHGWEVTDIEVTLTGGEHHTVHTHPLDFFVATPMAFMNGLQAAGTTLLEPILAVTIRAKEEYLGKILGDIPRMRGTFEAPEQMPQGGYEIHALIPAATSLDYPVELASKTSGTATYYSALAYYAPCTLEEGAEIPYRGISPLDRSKWILFKRGAIQEA